MLHHADELRLGMAAQHQAATRRRLAPEIDQRGRGDGARAEKKRAKSGPGRSEGQGRQRKRENERDRLADRRDLGAFDDGPRQGGGRQEIRRVLGRERDPGKCAARAARRSPRAPGVNATPIVPVGPPPRHKITASGVV